MKPALLWPLVAVLRSSFAVLRSLEMGTCHSCDSTAVATAKLVLDDGKLQEFAYPVKVSYVLQRLPACFICDSDEMDFGGFAEAIAADEELLPGQLYFALPLSWLKAPLRAEDMAALAVKASAALGKTCACRRRAAVAPVAAPRADTHTPAGGSRTRGWRGGGRNFTAKLSAIPE